MVPGRVSAGGVAEGEFLLDVVGSDGGGIEFGGTVEAQPVKHVLVLFVAGIGEDVFEFGVSPGAAAVLWWAGSLRGNQDGVVGLGIEVEQFFDDDLVLPVIAEVIGVAESVVDAADQLAESDLPLVDEPELGSGTPNSSGPLEKQCMWWSCQPNAATSISWR